MKLQICPDPQQLQLLVDGALDQQAEAVVEEHLGSAMEVAELLEACLAHVSSPLKNPLPTEPEALADPSRSQRHAEFAKKNRLAPQAHSQRFGKSHSSLRFVWTGRCQLIAPPGRARRKHEETRGRKSCRRRVGSIVF